MNELVHIHLLLNHWPIIGSFIGVALFLVALIANSDDLKQTSLFVFAFNALLALPTYMSGNVADEVFKETKLDASQMLIQSHQGAALLALTAMEITGAVALVGLWQFSRMSRPAPGSVARWNAPAVFILSIVTVILMSITGNTGGDIRHPEILSSEAAPSAVGAFGAKVVPAVSLFVTESSRWIWPALETLHFFGLILILAAIGALNVRLLGFFKSLSVAPLHRLLPWGLAGIAINIVTGMLFFVGMPYFYAFNITMFLKIGAIVLAGTTLLFFYCTGAFRAWANVNPGEDPPLFAKLLAATTLILWFAIIVLGRYIPLTQDSMRP